MYFQMYPLVSSEPEKVDYEQHYPLLEDLKGIQQSLFFLLRKVTEFSSLQILQSGCNPRHLNSRAFLDCSGLHLDYMDYKVIKWIAEQYNPKQSKGNLCNPSAIHCNLGLQFCFAIQINLCNLTAIQEDCSLIAEIAVALLRLQRFSNLHIRLVILPRVGEVA